MLFHPKRKKGFAAYKLNKNGTTVATLSINDTISLPAAATKYSSATDNVAGYPSVNQGTTTTGLLVNGRYQVKVLSKSTHPFPRPIGWNGCKSSIWQDWQN